MTASKHLLAGRVARIRVNPQDCMAVVDVLRLLELKPEQFTFDQAVRVALSSLLESARSHNAIPRRDGFEYSQMMSQFIQRFTTDRTKTFEVTKLINTASIRASVPDHTAERKFRRFEELNFKLQADSANISPAEQHELQQLAAELWPDPDLTNTKG